MPTSSRFRHFWHRVLTWSGPVLLLLCVLYKLIEWSSERWWFESLGYGSQYDSLIAWRFGCFALGAAILGCWLGFNAHLAWGNAARAHVPLSFFEAPASARLIPLEDKLQLDRYRRRVTLLLVGTLSWLAGLAFAAHYSLFLRAYYGAATGHTDAASNLDLTFFLFQLPLWSWLHRFCLGAIVAALFLVVAIYLYEETIAPPGRSPRVISSAARHLAMLWALLLLWKGIDCLMRVPLGFVNSGNIAARVFDVADVRFGWTSAAFFALTTPLVVLGSSLAIAHRPRWKTLVLGLGWMTIATMVPFILPILFKSSPTDPLWADAVQRHIRSTRTAWGLDEVDRQTLNLGPATKFVDSPPPGAFSFDSSLPIWPSGSVRDTLNFFQKSKSTLRVVASPLQRQGDALYYLNVLAPLAPDSDDWLERHHRSAQGQVIKALATHIGPDKKLACEAPLSTPILFGPSTNEPDDDQDSGERYPTAVRFDNDPWVLSGVGENEAQGVALQNFGVRAVLAARFVELKLVTAHFADREKIIWHRGAAERCRQIAPFLNWYSDEARPFVVSDEEKSRHLYWMVPGLVWSDDYPDSATPALPGTAPFGVNYGRQIALGVVDGRSGRVQLFALDEDEPFMALYRRAFPGLFAPLTALAMPLYAGVGPSATLLNAQSVIWARYHQEIPAQWQNNANDWRPLLPPSSEDNSLARPLSSQPSGDWLTTAFSPVGGQAGSKGNISNLTALMGADERDFAARRGKLRFVEWRASGTVTLPAILAEPPTTYEEGRIKIPPATQVGLAPLFDSKNRASGLVAVSGEIEQNDDSNVPFEVGERELLKARASVLAGSSALATILTSQSQSSRSLVVQNKLILARAAWRDWLTARRRSDWAALARAENELNKLLPAPESE